MDSRCFNVFHDPGDHARFTIGDGIHVDLNGILKKLINEDRMFGRGLHGALGEQFKRGSS